MARATATVVAGDEDFGLVTAETQAAGRPPVALAGSGAADIVEDGVTGYLFHEPTAEAVGEAMLRAREGKIATADLLASARRFDLSVFEPRLAGAIAAIQPAQTDPLPHAEATIALSGTRA
jgi:glycosyltransferase involved in cell wall biosynthesis